jgi:hypothetical protein
VVVVSEFPHSGHHGQDSITSVQNWQRGAITEGGLSGNPISLSEDGERTVGFPPQLNGSGAGRPDATLSAASEGRDNPPSRANPSGADESLPNPLVPDRNPNPPLHPDGGFDGGRQDRILEIGGNSGQAAQTRLAGQQLKDQFTLAQEQLNKPTPPSNPGGEILLVAVLIVGGVGAWWYFKHHKKGDGAHPLA